MKLYCFGESGHAYRAALMLELSGVNWEPVYVDYFNGGARSPDYLAINEMGEVPTLIDGDETITQGALIMMHISEKTGKFGGTTAAENREILRWMLFDTHKVSGQVGQLRFLMNFVSADQRNQGAIDFLTGRTTSTFGVLERRLTGRNWIATDAPTIADIALCGYLFYPEYFNFDRAEYPAIDAWLDRISALPGWKAPYDLMPGSPADRA